MTRHYAYYCPDMTCRAPMVHRVNGKTGEAFLGCTRYPDCWKTQPVPEREKLLAAGALELPGFETLTLPGFETEGAT